MTKRLDVYRNFAVESQEIDGILKPLDWHRLSIGRLARADDDLIALDAKNAVWPPLGQCVDVCSNDGAEM